MTPPGQLVPDPTPEDIRRECLKIQRTWSPMEERRRRGLRELPVLISARRCPEVHRLQCEVVEVAD